MPRKPKKSVTEKTQRGENPPTGLPDGTPEQGSDEVQWLTWAEVKKTRYEWLLPQRLAFGTVALLEGRKTAGKGTMAIALAAALAGGPKLPGGKKEKPSPVFWLGIEESVGAALRPRLEAAGGNPDLVFFPATGKDGLPRRLLLPGDLDVLEEAIATKRPRLIVLDPLSSSIAPGVNLNDDQSVRNALEVLAPISERYGLLTLFIRHFKKSRVSNAIDQGLGGAAIAAICRSVCRIDKDPDHPGGRLLAVSACNIGTVAETLRFQLVDCDGYPTVKWAGVSPLTAEELAEEAGDQGEQDARADARAYLLDALKGGPKPAEDLVTGAERTGISRGTLRRAKRDLHIRSIKKGKRAEAVWLWILDAKAN